MHVIVEDLDKNVESHDTYSVVLLSRNSSFNAVFDPATGEFKNLSPYYGAWVTPHIEPVQDIVRRAAELLPQKMIWGYQGEKSDPGGVATQVEALFNAFKEAGIAYVHSIIDFAQERACSPNGHDCPASHSNTAARTALMGQY